MLDETNHLMFRGSRAVLCRNAASVDRERGPRGSHLDRDRDRVGVGLCTEGDFFRQSRQIEVEAAKRTVSTETRLKALLEALVLVLSWTVSVQELVAQLVLRPGCEGAVHERDLDEKVDAGVQAVDLKRRRSEFEYGQLELERESVQHRVRGCAVAWPGSSERIEVEEGQPCSGDTALGKRDVLDIQ